MKANYEDKIKPTSNVTLGNLYDMNKQIMDKEPPMESETIYEKGIQIETWLEKYGTNKYFMLLCHEQRDYTVFNLDKTSTWAQIPALNIRLAREDVLECLTNRGTLLAADLQPDDVWEFWIRNDEGSFAYYFFPYGAAVLEY